MDLQSRAAPVQENEEATVLFGALRGATSMGVRAGVSFSAWITALELAYEGRFAGAESSHAVRLSVSMDFYWLFFLAGWSYGT